MTRDNTGKRTHAKAQGGVDAYFRLKFDQVTQVPCLFSSGSNEEVIAMVMYAKVGRLFFREHLSISEIGRRTSLSRNTIKKWLKAPDGTESSYHRAKATGKLTAYEDVRLKLWLEADARRPKRDRRTG